MVIPFLRLHAKLVNMNRWLNGPIYGFVSGTDLRVMVSSFFAF